MGKKTMKQILLLITTLFYLFYHTTLAQSLIFITKEKKSIVYQDIGKGTPLVLIHAFPTDQRLWKAQQKELKKYFRVITLDLWGFGQSQMTDGSAITMTDYADEVKQLLDKLQIQKAIIGGESMGGYIALAFLKKYPNEVKGLILSDTQTIADTKEIKAKREASAIEVLQDGTDHLINGFIPKALSKNAPDKTKMFLQNILTSQKAAALASALRGMALREDTSNILSTTSLPVLIITGDKDEVISPQQSKTMKQLAKNSRLVILTNAGHLSSLEQSSKWNQAVINMY